MRVEDELENESFLVVAAQAGDLSAFDTLARRYRKAALLVATRYCGREKADDAVQDALIEAFKYLPRLENVESFGGWLATIVKHCSMRLLKIDKPSVPLDDLILSYVPAIQERIEEDELWDCVQQAIATLDPDLAQVVGLYYGLEWSVGQVAQFLQLPETTVKWRLHTARKKLGTKLSVIQEIEENG